MYAFTVYFFVVFLPFNWSFSIVLSVTTLSFLACLTGLAYGSSYQRTFCIGAMLALAILFGQWCVLLLFGASTFGSNWSTRGGYPGYTWNQFREIALYVRQIAGGIRIFSIIMWALALVLGLIAVALRFTLETLNRRLR